MDQEAMMETDMLIVVDENDMLVEGVDCSKKKAHTFGNDSPRGILHRAFSFFLFNPQGEMLLTKRADSKITFPGVWTNACCSHPLHGMTPNEVDVLPQAYPEMKGIRNAAVRKLKQELGITADQLPMEDMRFIHRFHYWASDTITYGDTAPWGEHEVDYIIFLQIEEPAMQINPDEVSECKYLTIAEMKEMLQEPDLLWSPWFKGIMERGGFEWWENLDDAMAGKYTSETITFFDADPEHFAAYNTPEHTRLTGVMKS
eukprot:CAMPEP_0198127698 /NCGR_PEP_ID=MMETSP1442-20131203/47768_1 /TAXON_ID= /ORGANISM="Craspedostauros australis, Strain CCMP3328" /LENGTH=257 /DNA_ID=CAMNT_0043787723 /DNA_START=519 /DNA_END=1292 /DNA_ORIENTATION=+